MSILQGLVDTQEFQVLTVSLRESMTSLAHLTADDTCGAERTVKAHIYQGASRYKHTSSITWSNRIAQCKHSAASLNTTNELHIVQTLLGQCPLGMLPSVGSSWLCHLIPHHTGKQRKKVRAIPQVCCRPDPDARHAWQGPRQPLYCKRSSRPSKFAQGFYFVLVSV